MSELNQEVWTSQVKKKFYPDSSFLNFVMDFTSLVDNDKIHMAEAGIDPNVLINNTTYPIAVSGRVDSPKEFELDKFETENTLVRRPDVIEMSYDQLETVLYGHRQVLRAKTATKAAHAISPLADSDYTPVIQTTGGANSIGFKKIQFQDILRLKTRFDELDIPGDQRMLVLNPRHTEDLMLEDMKAFKDILEWKDGKPSRLAGFNILEFTKNAYYDGTTNQKKAFGAVVLATDAYSSFAFHSEEVMKADGQLYMYSTIDDPKERATIVGFDKRFICLPIRNKAIGAIISKTA